MRCRADRNWLLKALRLHCQVASKSLHESFKYVRLTLGRPEGLQILSQTLEATIITNTHCDAELLGTVTSISVRADALRGVAEATSAATLGLEVRLNGRAVVGLRVSWKGGSLTLPAATGCTVDYIEPTKATTQAVPSAEFLQALNRVEHLVLDDPEEHQAAYGFVRVEQDGADLRLVATTGKALAVACLPGFAIMSPQSALHIPLSTVQLIRSIKVTGDVVVQVNGAELGLWFSDETRIFARTGAIAFPDWKSVLPRMASRVLRASCEELSEVVARAAALGNSSVTLSRMGDLQLRVEISGACGGGSAVGVDTVSLQHCSGDFEPVCLSAQLLNKCLGKLRQEEFVDITVYAPERPVVLQATGDLESYWQVVVPMKRGG